MPRIYADGEGPRLGLSPAAYGELTRSLICDFITEHTTERGSPNIPEISRGIGRSTRAIKTHITAMRAEGVITKKPGTNRGLRVVPKEERTS